ncbi:hypothetical protein QR680_010179 [Steinernema hermaphroditum]|uniref:Uncharacterized protein n=1 Tax=Steinernema hermaphroditum TaxID=289476 RepID=A0AA39IPZ0_9BILA|nr:hypothetical protein QR680_010179 [Steinernema hermaphroditum]
MIFKSELPPLPAPDRPLPDIILDALWKYGTKSLIDAQTHEQATFQQLYLQSLSVAAFLENRKFRHGDVACTVMHNCLEYLPVFVGVTSQGGALSSASYSFAEYELANQFKDCGASIVFCNEENLEKVFKVAHQCRNITSIVVIPDATKNKRTHPFGVVAFDEVLSYQPNVYSHKIDTDIHRDIAALPYSSGTTGPPKGVMLSHTNLALEADIMGHHIEHFILRKIDPDYRAENETDIIFMPLYHMYGFCVLLSNIMRGQTTVLLERFDFELYCKSIEKYKIRHLKLVPPVLVLLAKHPLVDKYNLSSVMAILSGAAPAGKELCEDIMRRLPNLKIVGQGYGLTEATAGTHFMVYDPEKPKVGSIGKVASNTEMKIVCPETGQECSYNQRGEVWIRGKIVMLGYLNRPEATAQIIDDDGWLHTGDVGYVDTDGFVFIVDRLKELIKVKGFQVPPAELEDYLLTHPLIQDVAVIGIPDERHGELPMAFVVRKNNSLKAEDVANYVKNKLADYKQLRGGVQFIKEIPKSPSGKILRRFLRDEAALLKKSKL